MKYLLSLIFIIILCTPAFSQKAVDNLYIILLPKSETSAALEGRRDVVQDLLQKGIENLPNVYSESSHIMVFRYGYLGKLNPYFTESLYFDFAKSVRIGDETPIDLKGAFSKVSRSRFDKKKK